MVGVVREVLYEHELTSLTIALLHDVQNVCLLRLLRRPHHSKCCTATADVKLTMQSLCLSLRYGLVPSDGCKKDRSPVCHEKIYTCLVD